MCKLLIICGLSFAGKSTLGNAIAKRFGHDQVDVDVTKVRLYGENARDDQLTQSDWDRIYRETDNVILSCLQAGKAVIDASRNFRKAERQQIRRTLVRTAGTEIATIYVDTPEAVARKRLHENRVTRTRVDCPDAAFDQIANIMEPPGRDEEPLIFPHESNMDAWIARHARYLMAFPPGPISQRP
jgi:predicted kinase